MLIFLKKYEIFDKCIRIVERSWRGR